MPRAAHRQAVRARRHGHRDPRKLRRRRRVVLPLGAGGRGAVARRSVDRRAGRRAEHARHQRLLRWGSDDIKRRYLPTLASRRSAPTACRKPARAATRSRCRRAPIEVADGYALTGRKLWITNGNEADLFLVFANVNPDAGYRGITGFLVERGMPGLHRRQEGRQARHPRQQHLRAAVRRLRRRRDRVLGEVGKGYKVAIETLNEGRIGIGAQMIGLAQGALDHAVRYTKERQQFGKPIADFQGVQFQLARMAIDVEVGAAAGLQRRAPARRRAAVPARSGDVQDRLVRSRRARGLDGGQSVRRLRLRAGLPGREAVSATPRSGRSTRARRTCSW